MSGDVRTQPSSANSVISTATVQNEDQKNILIQGNNSADVVIQNAMDQGPSSEMGQDGLSQNIIITTEVEGGEQQIIQTMTGEFGDGETYVVQYVQDDSWVTFTSS